MNAAHGLGNVEPFDHTVLDQTKETPSPVRRSRGRQQPRLLSIADLWSLPEPTWLVEGVLAERSFGALYGPPASYKSFAALDLALSISAGRPWAGRAVSRAPVLYIAAEGSGGLRRRVDAWTRAHGVEAIDCHFVIQPVPFLDEDAVDGLIEVVGRLAVRPALTVIDTLARSFGGGDENLARDMNKFVAAIDRLRATTGGAALVVHHAPSQGGKLRGSSALPGALDVIVAANRERNDVILVCEKQKDQEEFQAIRFAAMQVALGEKESSLALVPVDDVGLGNGAALDPWDAVRDASRRDRLMLDQLVAFGTDGASTTEWETACKAVDIPHTTFFRARKELVAGGTVERFEESGQARYRVPDRNAVDPESDSPLS